MTVYIEGPDGFEPIGELDSIHLAREEIDGTAWNEHVEFLTELSASMTLTLSLDQSLQARRALARVLGDPIPTTAGIDLYPDTEQRAAEAVVRSRALSRVTGQARLPAPGSGGRRPEWAGTVIEAALGRPLAPWQRQALRGALGAAEAVALPPGGGAFPPRGAEPPDPSRPVGVLSPRAAPTHRAREASR